jgi:hypothetical protein
VVAVAIVERIEPTYPVWTPASGVSGARGAHALADDEEYTGKHRKPGRRLFALTRMFYNGQHRRI